MLKSIVVNNKVYTKNSDDSDLEFLLLQHLGLDRVNDIKIQLAETELFTLKSWLIKRTESNTSPGTYKSVSHGIQGLNGGPMEIVFARGKALNGEVILWHEPCPWPKDWPKQQSIVSAPSALELIKIEDQLALRYDDIVGIFTAPEAFKFINILKLMKETDYDKPHKVQFSNGNLYIHIYATHVNFEFSILQPKSSSLSTSLDKIPLRAGIEDFEAVVREFFKTSNKLL